MKRQIASAIEFSSGEVRCVIGERLSTGALDVLGAGACEYQGLRRGRFMDPPGVTKAASRAMERAQEQARLRIRRTVVGVPGSFSYAGVTRGDALTTGADKQVSEADMRAVLSDAMDFLVPVDMELIHRVAQCWYLDGRPKSGSPKGNVASHLAVDASLVFAPKSLLSSLDEMLMAKNVDVYSFVSVPLSLPLYVVPERERAHTSALIDVGVYTTDVCIMKHSGLSYHEVIEVGSRHICADLANGLDISLQQAAQVARRYIFSLSEEGGKHAPLTAEGNPATTFEYAVVAKIVDARVSELAELIRAALERSSVPMSTRSRIYISGAMFAEIRGVREFMEGILKMPVRTYIPRSLPVGAEFVPALSLIAYALKMHIGEETGAEEQAPINNESVFKRIVSRFVK